MKLYEVRDVVREQVGRDRLSDPMLDWCVQYGLRELEKCDNWYWMEAVKSFSMIVDQQDYSIYTATSGGLNIPNYKDSRILFVSDQTQQNPSWDEVWGPETIEEVKLSFSDTDTGMPCVWTQKETGGGVAITVESLMQIWPPNPDKIYSMELHYFQWTSLPTDVTTDTHEVLLRWPEALIYLATAQAMIVVTKDLAAGNFWKMMFRNPDPRKKEGEYYRIQRYNAQRQHATRSEIRPRNSGNSERRGKWRRNKELWV